MYYKSRKLHTVRERLTEQLEALGWQPYQLRNYYKPNGRQDISPTLFTPQIIDDFLEFETRLKKINTGEAYWRTETNGQRMLHLAWRCRADNPNNHHPLDTFDAFEMVREMMINGLDFEYDTWNEKGRKIKGVKETIRYIDWEHPERNTYEYAVGWRGPKNDGFAWDIVLLINMIPVGGIVLEGAKSARVREGEEVKENLPCQNAYELAFRQLYDDYHFPVYCHSLIIGNGKQLMIGDPWMEIEEFLPIDHLEDVLRPTEFLLNRIKEL